MKSEAEIREAIVASRIHLSQYNKVLNQCVNAPEDVIQEWKNCKRSIEETIGSLEWVLGIHDRERSIGVLIDTVIENLKRDGKL